ncbi:hypothetical protein CT19425_U610015 [Cupriavidus taiwanensis]|uniref:Uncharacterized protein n=1 Tax=Cupriavidus taiwanensis TaxID=164546 RepID=A0A375IAS9_9BURK|nr:hypothetical protein CT19425_U610015 [Cupriavidus taiwanensis]
MHSDNSKLGCFAAAPPLFHLPTNTWMLDLRLGNDSMTAL